MDKVIVAREFVADTFPSRKLFALDFIVST